MTETAKPTPGPWVADAFNDIRAGEDTVICAMGRSYGLKTYYTTPAKSETLANARLIAASPTMLEALKGIEKHADVMFKQMCEFNPRAAAKWKAVLAAIALAEGRT